MYGNARRTKLSFAIMIGGVLLLSLLHGIFPWFDLKLKPYKKTWYPFSGGVAIGYVFLYLLPKLSDYTSIIIQTNPDSSEFGQYRVFVFCLMGFMTYYLIDHFHISRSDDTNRRFHLHSLGLLIYNVFVGAIFASFPRTGMTAPLVGIFCLSVHALGTNHQARAWQPIAFDRVWRWLFILGVIAGWSINYFIHMPKDLIILAWAFLAGAIIVNVMAEELPESGQTNIWPFLGGVLFVFTVALIMRSSPRSII